MRLTGMVGRTLRSAPAGVPAWIGLAARAGLLRPVSGGLLLLPLGAEAVRRIAGQLLGDLDADDVTLWAEPGSELEALAGLLVAEVQSYRQLPMRIATSDAGWGIDIPGSSRGTRGQCAVAGAFAGTPEAEGFLGQVADSVGRLARHCGLTLLESGQDSESGDWLVPEAQGGRAYRSCPQCGTRWRLEAAPFRRSSLPGAPETLRLVHTPQAATIEALATLLGVDRNRTLKALFLEARTGELVLAVVRGDLDVGLEKLARLIGREGLRPAVESSILAAGCTPGFASPIGLRVSGHADSEGVLVALDESVYSGRSFAAGANQVDYHYLGVDAQRDFESTFRGDVALAPQGAACEVCETLLLAEQGTPLAMHRLLPPPTFADEAGLMRPGRAVGVTFDLLAWFQYILLGAADETGIAWPAVVSPADVHLIDLNSTSQAHQAAQQLEANGLRVLVDDRPLGAGAKFTDADLIGCPLRLTVSSRSLKAGGAELSLRKGLSPEIVPLESVAAVARVRLQRLMSS
jgi:prolyl-tRNA synthetase